MRERDALATLAPPGLDVSSALLDVLERTYASPPRAYHTLAHVRDVATWHAQVAREVGWRQPHETYLAVLFHDAVYLPGARDNEARSAELARVTLTGWPVDLERIGALIELTARHGSIAAGEVDPDAALFLDCDMAILGADAETFEAYDAAIRAEYAHLPDAAYRAGRRAFLERLLAAPRMFLSSYFDARLAARARANLALALARAADVPDRG